MMENKNFPLQLLSDEYANMVKSISFLETKLEEMKKTEKELEQQIAYEIANARAALTTIGFLKEKSDK